ncbi:ornithine cyclodeaminase [Ruegeria pomeroyi]|uniref:Ornithine cyclodeaminase n=1 Tax=Ruegeria pomeroyi TaxID=89184 RepID=A0A9Q3WHU1_9RHOB|nr:ornithine cyclodeaminase [Ruegeria pomeroyi]MCE8523414.1 ornithine cyclodeaminase [Ruegeria pomeroyi]MCE8527475.1 ornithine cyclodeaminase [Ruegeria pomeroyi]MCE8534211.1 ornithine cyclodeaminase [Ruegeria pomeroyi]MCE8540035.1 ornithine cyclodeaminase [Ruegeria pomeroyi]
MSIPHIPFAEGEAKLDWLELTRALADGHSLPKAQIGDTFLYRDPDTMLTRSAWIDGLGIAVKTANIFPRNPERGDPMINGAVNLYSDHDGALSALVDFHLVTKWKTAGDSLLAALRLADPDAREVLVVGAGTVGLSLCEAFGTGFPKAALKMWNRTRSKAEEVAARYDGLEVVDDLATAVNRADIIVTATMSSEPVIRGEWLRPGQHLNLIGAYRPDMREADDEAMRRARIFVDSFDTTVDHIGELMMPLADGVITRADVVADYYDLDAFKASRDDITVFKNGGGAHLDLMTSRYILDKWQG